MDQTYNRTFTAKPSPRRVNVNETFNRTPNPHQTYVETPRRPNRNLTYETTPRRGNPNLTYDKSPQANRTYNKSSERQPNRTYNKDEDSDESSSIDFVQEEDYTPESPTPTFESSESSYAVDSFSKFGAPSQQSTPKRNLNFLQEFDVLGPIMKQLDHSIRNNLGQTFTKSPGEKYATPSDRTWTIFVDDMNNEHKKRSKSTPRRPTTSPQYYMNTPTTRTSPSNGHTRQNKMVARKLDFGSGNVDNQLHFSNRVTVTRTEPNGHSVTFTSSKSGPDISVLKNRDC